jgi:hypothetical protein
MVKTGLNPGSCQRIQVATVQSVALCGSELWWREQNNRVQEVQKLLNEQGRRITTGCFRTTPQGALMNDTHQQKLNLLHQIYLVYCTHKLKKMKSRFP